MPCSMMRQQKLTGTLFCPQKKRKHKWLLPWPRRHPELGKKCFTNVRTKSAPQSASLAAKNEFTYCDLTSYSGPNTWSTCALKSRLQITSTQFSQLPVWVTIQRKRWSTFNFFKWQTLGVTWEWACLYINTFWLMLTSVSNLIYATLVQLNIDVGTLFICYVFRGT